MPVLKVAHWQIHTLFWALVLQPLIRKKKTQKTRGGLSCLDFLLLKPMLKKRGGVRTPGFAPSSLGCRHHQHMNHGFQRIPRETNSSTHTKANGCTPVFLLFPSLLILPFPCSPSILPCFPCPSLILPPPRLLENTHYGDISAKGSPDQEFQPCCKLTIFSLALTCFPFSWAAAKNYRLWNLCVLFPLWVVGICWSQVPFHMCKLLSPGILLLTLL